MNPDDVKKTPATKSESVEVEPVETPDVEAAERADVSEGDIKALRDDAGLVRLPGNEGNVKVWEASEAGKAFLKGEAERVKQAEAAAKAAHADLDKDGLSEADKKYEETVGE